MVDNFCHSKKKIIVDNFGHYFKIGLWIKLSLRIKVKSNERFCLMGHFNATRGEFEKISATENIRSDEIASLMTLFQLHSLINLHIYMVGYSLSSDCGVLVMSRLHIYMPIGPSLKRKDV
jgi:hypothetical protein